MTCSECHREIKPTETVCVLPAPAPDHHTVIHERCFIAREAAECPPWRTTRPSVSDHTIESLTAMVTRTLAIPAVGGETYSEWLSGRCAALVQLLINDWGGDCRNCGACPLREISDVTEPIYLNTAKGT